MLHSHLQKLILTKTRTAQAQAVFGPQNPTGHTFSIILRRVLQECLAQLIVYTDHGTFGKFKVLAEASSKGYVLEFDHALELLEECVQKKIDEELPGM